MDNHVFTGGPWASNRYSPGGMGAWLSTRTTDPLPGPTDPLPGLIDSLFGNGEQGAMFIPKPQVHGQQVLWQDEGRTVPATSAGDPVYVIDDISGNGHHAYAFNSSSRGVLVDVGGKLRLYTDGVDDCYIIREETAQLINVLRAGTTAGFTFFLRANFIDTDRVFGFGSGTSTARPFALDSTSTSSRLVYENHNNNLEDHLYGAQGWVTSRCDTDNIRQTSKVVGGADPSWQTVSIPSDTGFQSGERFIIAARRSTGPLAHSEMHIGPLFFTQAVLTEQQIEEAAALLEGEY